MTKVGVMAFGGSVHIFNGMAALTEQLRRWWLSRGGYSGRGIVVALTVAMMAMYCL